MTTRYICGDSRNAMKEISDKSIQCVITSPPYYGLRDYGVDGQIGLEQTPDEYVANLVAVFREVKRVLKDDGTLWINLGDSYAGSGKGLMGDGSHSVGGKQETNKGSLGARRIDRSKRNASRWGGGNLPATGNLKSKDLIGIPWMVAFALRADGWYLRSDIIWAKPNPMPESVTDRPTKSHEYVFLLTKSAKYYYNAEAIKEQSIWSGDPRAGYGRLHYRGKREGENGTGNENEVLITENKNKRTVWTIATQPCKEAHFAVMPEDLVTPCILAGSKPKDIILDPFGGAGTVGLVAKKLGRDSILIELNPKYIDIQKKRINSISEALF